MSNRSNKKTTHSSAVRFRRNAVAIAVSGAVSAFGISGTANAQNEVLEELVVTGIFKSLQDSSEFKRGSSTVVDAISSEDLGKFPDANVADSLSRITGVAVARTRGGEGRFITVRGLGEEFNGVTYNGRLIATENDGREFSFDVIASELISGAQVYKTSAAKQVDGSLGGLVNVNTAKPLDNPGFNAAGSVSTQYEELADNFSPQFSGVISNSWNDDTIGLLASISYQKRENRTDIAESNFLIFPVDVDSAGNASQGQDGNGDGLSDVSGLPLVTSEGRFNGFSGLIAEQERERVGGTLVLQYQPTDTFSMTLDALYTKFESPGEIYGYSYFPSAFGPGFTSNAQLNDANQIVSHTSNAFAYDALARRTEGDTETIQFGGNFEWQLTDTSSLVVDASYSKADGQRDNLGSAAGSGAFFVVGVAGGRVQQTFTGREVPDFTFDVPNPNGPGFISSGDLRPEDYRVHFGRNDILLVEDEVVSLKGDYELELTDTSRLSVGLSYVDRQKVNRSFTNTSVACTLCGYATTVGAGGVDISGLVTGSAPSDFLSGIGSNIPRNFDRFDLDVVQAGFISQAPAGTYTPTINEAGSTNVEESVLGAYVQYDWDGQLGNTPFKANIGLRAAKTDLTSTGFGNQLTDISAIELLSDGNNQNFTIAAPRALSLDNDYTDILPSFNISFDLRDDLVLRGALSKTVSRPTLTSLSTSFIVTSQNRGGEAITVNNPELEAIESDNIDLSLEWYGEGGTSASAALFYKDISNFVTQVVTTEPVSVNFTNNGVNQGTQTVNFLVQRPENGDEAEILGIELGGQYLSNSGFGVAANVTLTDSEASSAGAVSDLPLENISDEAANLSVFYEGERFTARISGNYRSEYLVGQTIEGGRNEFVDDNTQVDLSISYDINDSLTAFLDGVNVLDEPFFRFSETRQLLETYEENGSRWTIGLRGSF